MGRCSSVNSSEFDRRIEEGMSVLECLDFEGAFDGETGNQMGRKLRVSRVVRFGVSCLR